MTRGDWTGGREEGIGEEGERGEGGGEEEGKLSQTGWEGRDRRLYKKCGGAPKLTTQVQAPFLQNYLM